MRQNDASAGAMIRSSPARSPALEHLDFLGAHHQFLLPQARREFLPVAITSLHPHVVGTDRSFRRSANLL